MRYADFEKIVSQKRINRYVQACGGNTRKAMTLYRYNIELSQVMFAIICHFEVALRNAIDCHLVATLGSDWIRNSVMPNGVFTHPVLYKTRDIIYHAYNKLLRNRIAHHEPICFPIHGSMIYTDYILNEYRKIMMLFQWMGIDGEKLLFGLDHVRQLCIKIDKLKPV